MTLSYKLTKDIIRKQSQTKHRVGDQLHTTTVVAVVSTLALVLYFEPVKGVIPSRSSLLGAVTGLTINNKFPDLCIYHHDWRGTARLANFFTAFCPMKEMILTWCVASPPIWRKLSVKWNQRRSISKREEDREKSRSKCWGRSNRRIPNSDSGQNNAAMETTEKKGQVSRYVKQREARHDAAKEKRGLLAPSKIIRKKLTVEASTASGLEIHNDLLGKRGRGKSRKGFTGCDEKRENEETLGREWEENWEIGGRDEQRLWGVKKKK